MRIVNKHNEKLQRFCHLQTIQIVQEHDDETKGLYDQMYDGRQIESDGGVFT